MLEHAKNLEFEKAAFVRDEIEKIKGIGRVESAAGQSAGTGKKKAAQGKGPAGRSRTREAPSGG
jgi:excinuclease UvrABC nuclease subunit